LSVVKKLLLIVIVPLLALGLSSCGTPLFDFDGDGAPDALDCAPTDPEVRWGLDEVLDGKDNDCDGVIDEGTAVFDDDGDGYCEGLWDEDVGGWVRRHDGPDDDRNCGVGEEDPGDLRVDCDDGDADQSPRDADADDWDTCGGPDGDAMLDCDDSNPAVYPHATELCDGYDNDCDNRTGPPGSEDGDDDDSASGDDDDSAGGGMVPGLHESEVDQDGDGELGCLDCDDEDATVNHTDLDADGFSACNLPPDCDDEDANTYPGAPEVCDGLVNDCGALGKVEPDHGLDRMDADGDGHFACVDGDVVDCDDSSARIYPGAVEICDGEDSDCDGSLSTQELDSDQDTMLPCGGDCDDLDPQISPAAFEIAGNGIDEDCDCLGDTDGDGVECDQGDEGVDEADAVWCDVVFDSLSAPSLTVKIALATHGDTICVEPGKWYEFIDFGDKAVELVGMGGPLVTHVAPGVPAVEGESNSLVTFVEPSPVAESRPALRGFTLAGNTKVKMTTENPGENTEGQGGAIYIRGAAPILDRLVILQNVAEIGGGVYIEGPAEAQGTTIQRSFIYINSASCDSLGCDGGGGIFARGGVSLEVEASYLAFNQSDTDGGGLALAGASVDLNQTKLQGNTAGAQGGGLYGGHEGDPQVTVSMNHVQLAGNVAGGSGGGLHLRGRNENRAALDMEYVSILRNVSLSEGGGVSLQHANLTANHTAWVANMSSGTGAALRCAVTTLCELEATDVSFNISFVGGGALSLGGSAGLNFLNTYENSQDFDCDGAGEGCGLTSFVSSTLSPGYLDQAGIEAGVDSVVAGGVSTAFFDAPWAWELQLHQDPDADPPGLQDPDPPLPETDPDGGPEDLGIYGGVDADQWDLDGDGAPQAWQPGGYDALTPTEAAGLDCNDTSPFVWNGSPWLDCPPPSGSGE